MSSHAQAGDRAVLRPWFVRSGISTGHRSRRSSRRSELMSVETRPTKGASPPAPAAVVVMGVSGCGKSTIGALLASRLRWEFEDADWFHPASKVDKIHNGIALTPQGPS